MGNTSNRQLAMSDPSQRCGSTSVSQEQTFLGSADQVGEISWEQTDIGLESQVPTLPHITEHTEKKYLYTSLGSGVTRPVSVLLGGK